MRLETCIRKGLGLKAHRVRAVVEEGGQLVVFWFSVKMTAVG
jgi:hypothetical protein